MASRARRANGRGIETIWQVIGGIFRRMSESDMQFLAGSLAFGTVISLVPLLAVSLSVFVMFGGLEDLLKKVEPFLLQNLVEGSGVQVSHYIRSSIERIQAGKLGESGVAGLLLISTKLFYDIETAVQRIWLIESRRSMVARWLTYWVVIFGGPFLLAIILGTLSSKNVDVVKYVPKEILTFGFASVSLFFIYKLLPAQKVSVRAAFWSAVLTSIAIVIAQDTYVIITAHILRVNKIYGSLASIPIFLIWILTLWWIFLIGVALTAMLHRKFHKN